MHTVDICVFDIILQKLVYDPGKVWVGAYPVKRYTNLRSLGIYYCSSLVETVTVLKEKSKKGASWLDCLMP